jgi:hypothetical protein
MCSERPAKLGNAAGEEAEWPEIFRSGSISTQPGQGLKGKRCEEMPALLSAAIAGFGLP